MRLPVGRFQTFKRFKFSQVLYVELFVIRVGGLDGGAVPRLRCNDKEGGWVQDVDMREVPVAILLELSQTFCKV